MLGTYVGELKATSSHSENCSRIVYFILSSLHVDPVIVGTQTKDTLKIQLLTISNYLNLECF